MSQETSIGNLNNSISEEDSQLVDSILNDLNSGNQKQQPEIPSQGGQLSPEQAKAIQLQKQQISLQQQQMAQQQMAQQQMAQQQMAQQQMAQQKGAPLPNMNHDGNKQINTNSIIDNIKRESKSIILVIFLSFVLNLEPVNNLLRMQPGLFVTEKGSINLQGLLLKSILIGVVYYGVKSYLL